MTSGSEVFEPEEIKGQQQRYSARPDWFGIKRKLC